MKRLVFVLLLGSIFTVFPWELTEKNNHITDIPTMYDFMPDGITCIEGAGHSVIFPPDDPQCSFR